jgi:pimeloyl-ACP methyl ester carboxylesterase
VQEIFSVVRPDERYLLYAPALQNGNVTKRLLVVVHGYTRKALSYLEQFVGFADRHDYILLAPVFSATKRYQVLGIGGASRSDLRLLDLIDEVSDQHGLDAECFDLFGYSGGGQFAHRFLYLHPRRLGSVVVGAPGTVTVPSRRYPWPAGVASLSEQADAAFDLETIRRARIMLIVGKDDLGLDDLNQSERAMRFGVTRLGRARTLHAAWQVAGIPHKYVEVPGVGHRLGETLLAPVYRFLASGRDGGGD